MKNSAIAAALLFFVLHTSALAIPLNFELTSVEDTIFLTRTPVDGADGLFRMTGVDPNTGDVMYVERGAPEAILSEIGRLVRDRLPLGG